jgi:hypothetical protein
MSASGDPPRHVAVVAIHGVADQKPHSSAEMIADVLVRTGRYRAFSATAIRIPVGRVPVGGARDGDLAQRFMRGQLLEFEVGDKDTVYDTVCLSAGRDPSPRPSTVDVYELHWADLSRVGAGAFRVFGELYQILLHMCRLGTHALERNGTLHNRTGWRVLQGVQITAAWLLAVPIALLNLWLAAMTTTVLPNALPAAARRPVATLLPVIVAALASTILIFRARVVPRALWMATAIVGSIGAGALLFWWARGLSEPAVHRLLAFEGSAAGAAVAAILMVAYARRRPGAGHAGLLIGGVLILLLWSRLAMAPLGAEEVWRAGLEAAEIGSYAMSASWAAFFLMSLLMWPAGAWAMSGIDEEEAKGPARASVQTARLALAIPAAVFLPSTVALWAGIFIGLGRLPDLPKTYAPILWWEGFPADWPAGGTSLGHFVQHLVFGVFGHSGAIPALALLAAAVLLALWAIAPLALSELWLPKDPRADEQRYGTWLDRAFEMCGLSARLIMLAMFVVWAFVPIATRWWWPDRLRTDAAANLLGPAGFLLLSGLLGLSVLRGPLSGLALGFRPIVDVALDVDNHLREHPRSSNPRGRFSARLFSLLSFIQDGGIRRDQGGYAGIVIVTHSQGSVIAADLLRFLHFDGHPLRIRTWLLTMGCPLRQLYARRFPYLYGWAQRPTPQQLDVQRWENLFRSGDYVGRALWTPDPPPDDAAERCIGGGAHVRYWDGSSPDVGLALDGLVTRA